MDGNPYARYRTTLLVTAGLFAVWGLLSVFDIDDMPFAGYQTDGNNTVVRITAASPAEQAGMQVGDVIRRIAGIPVEDAAAQARLLRPGIGEARTYVVERNGTTLNLELTFAGLPGRLQGLTFAMILVGFGFMLFGLMPYLKAPSARTTLLALFGLGLGFSFFGGPYVASYTFQTMAVLISTLFVVLGFATLLHFTLTFPKRKALLGKRFVRDLLYAPGALVFLFLLYRALFQPPATSALNRITGVLVGVFILGYFGLSLASFVHSYAKARPQARKAQGLTYVLAGLLAGFLPVLFVILVRLVAPTVTIPGSNFFFLTIVLIPISLSLAVMKSDKASVSAGTVDAPQPHVSLST